MYAIKKWLLTRYIGCLSLLLSCQFITGNESVLISDQEFIGLMHEEENDILYRNMATEEELEQLRGINPKKAVTLFIYIAADNDLHAFAWKNIKQLEMIGSNDNINIIVQLHTPGLFNPTKRYIIQKGKRLLVPAEGTAPTQKLNSGDPQTLIDGVAWAMKYYPADILCIDLWNHGSGMYDPGKAKIINSFDLFHMNEATQELELDRTVGYAQLMDQDNDEDFRQNGRGICFDDTFKSYMSNQDLKFALSEIQNTVLNGQKIGLLWFDACLMAMLEIANICKDHVEYLVGSEEVEFASGSNYELALRPFVDRALTSREFACHIVNSYEKAYQYITKDYTQSAIDLSMIAQLEANVNLVAEQILSALQSQKNNSMTKLLYQCKTRPFCTCFEEPSYIDLRDFYMNLQSNLGSISLTDPSKEGIIRFNLLKLLDYGINLINSAVINNKVGSNLSRACGLSIYFPERGMFASYPKCNFAQTNNWSTMLIKYLTSKNK